MTELEMVHQIVREYVFAKANHVTSGYTNLQVRGAARKGMLKRIEHRYTLAEKRLIALTQLEKLDHENVYPLWAEFNKALQKDFR